MRRGRPQTIETRAKISAANQGNQYALGTIRSPETRAKIAAYQRSRRGPLSPSWKGGRRITVMGYIRIFVPNHPYADHKGCVFEHRLIAEKALGRHLKPKEMVHHVNEQKGENLNQNLVICEDDKYHKLIHRRMRQFQESSGIALVGRVPAEILKKDG